MEPCLDDALREARSGSQAAYAVLWHRLSPTVLGFLRAKGAGDPEALTSEVFVQAFARISDFAGDVDQLRALLFTIAQRRLVDDFRRRSSRPVEVAWDDARDDRPEDSAEHRVVALHGDREARALLEDLPPDQKDVLMLRIFGDLKVEQIAVALDRSPGAVKALQRRGLQSLRRRLEGPDPAREEVAG